jgi:hypothetical protein
MPKRIVSWAVLLFSFAIISFGYKSETNQWGVSFDNETIIPNISIPYIVYEVLGIIAIAVSIFFIFASFYKWRETVEEWVNKKGYYPSFIIFIVVYGIGFIRGLSAVISIEPPIWIRYLVLCFGLGLLVILIIWYVKGIAELKRQNLIQPVPAKGDSGLVEELPSIDIVLDEVRRKLDFQFEQLDGLAIKAGIVLGVAGVIFTLLVTNLLSQPSISLNLYLAKVALIPIILALVLAFIAIYILTWDRPPKLERLRDYYIVKDAQVTKLNVIDKCLEAIEKNKKLMDRLFFLVKCSYFLLLIGFVLLAVWIGTNIW